MIGSGCGAGSAIVGRGAQPREDQIERDTRHRIAPRDVTGAEIQPRSDLGGEMRQRRGTEPRVDVEPGDVALGTHGLADDAHDGTRPAAGIEAPHSRGKPRAVQHPDRRCLEDLRLRVQPVRLGLCAREQIAVAVRVLMRGHHASPGARTGCR